MPIYEYKCSECGHQLEAIQKVNDAPLKDCPACKRGSLKRLVSAAGFQLKGSGWYATDFKNKGRKQPDQSKSDTKESGDKSSESADKSSSDTGGDTTPAKKAHGCGGGACGCA
jgi:putative FmdB family regulatory protein